MLNENGTASLSDSAEKFLAELKKDAKALVEELLEKTELKERQILVIGCSTSEIIGNTIGKASVPEVADTLLDGIMSALEGKGIYLAAQCCEHLNRAIIVERECAEKYGLDPVSVRPMPKAGGSFATAVYDRMTDPVAVETIKGHAGLDIGGTLIGMHLRHVAVPIRLSASKLGFANVICAYTRPKYIGGPRAVYK
ncbi:MAG: TIGR01440 family protein [Clostridia bacterium]|nr:TIGR01440 family protein [Clostridia bacterium]